MCPRPVPSFPSHIFLENAFDCVVPPVAVRRVSKQILSYSQIRQNCSDDSTEVTEGVTSTPEIFSNKQGATLTPEICSNKHSFVPTVFTTITIYVNCKRCKPSLNHRN